mgnify:FL=1
MQYNHRMPRSPDEPVHSPEQPENSEIKPQREIFKELARTQLDSIGYSIVVVQLENFFKSKGIINEMDKLLPHLFGTDDDFLNHMVRQIKSLPNPEEARKLLGTALFGEPALRNADGTITVTSYTLSEPSTTTTQSKFSILRDKRKDTHFKPNIKSTDKLVRKLISGSGFLEEGQTAEIIFQLKKGKKVTLPHLTIQSLNMELEEPLYSGKNDTRTAYSYSVRTTLTPS